jgi:D-alanyl-lipoteichoic acid acyltransferase DltB (MBOAT superfamily)
VYIPLGGSRPNIPEAIRLKGDKAIEARYAKWIAVRNTFIIFLLSGFWHGANWTFVLWGAYHALLFVPLLLMNKNRRYRDTVATVTLPDGTIKTKLLPSLKEAGQMLLNFALAVFGWIIFRVQDVGDIWLYMTNLFSRTIVEMPMMIVGVKRTILAIAILLFFEWINRAQQHGLQIERWHVVVRYIIYYLLMLIISELGANSQSFIYFQF